MAWLNWFSELLDLARRRKPAVWSSSSYPVGADELVPRKQAERIRPRRPNKPNCNLGRVN